MANSIAYVRNYTSILDEVYKRAACSTCLNSPRRMARAGRNAKEIMVSKIEVSGLGDYTRNVGYKTGSTTYEFETKTFNYDRGIRLLADVMDVEETGVLDCFVAAGSELQRTQVATETDAFTFSEIAGHEGVAPVEEDFSDADAEDALASLRTATNEIDEAEVTTENCTLLITATIRPCTHSPYAPVYASSALLEKSCSASQARSASVSGISMRSILKITGRVPSLQQAIIMRSSAVQPCMMEPPCRAV